MRRLPLVVLILGLAGITVLVSLRVDRGPFQRGPVGYEAVFWSQARNLTSTTPSPGFVPSPTALTLSPLVTDSVTAVRDARRVLTWIYLPLLSLLVWALARKRAGPWPATAAALAAAACGPLVLAAGSLAPAAPAAVAGLAALVVLDHERNWIGWLVAGALTGLAYRFEPLLGTGLGILLLIAAWVPRGAWRRGPASLALVGAWAGVAIAVGFIQPLGPPPAPVTGIEFYQGHRAAASGVFPRRGDQDAQRWWSGIDFLREASREEDRRVTSAEGQRFWLVRGLRESFSSPISGFRRNAAKVLATYQGDPLALDLSPAFIQTQADDRGGMAAVIWLGRILVPLGVAGLILARRRAGRLWAGALSGLVASWLAYADPQTRLLSVACATVGIALLAEVWTRGSGRRRAATVGVAVLAVGVLGFGPSVLGWVPGMKIQSDDYYYLGALYDSEKRGSVAMREYERALRADPDNPYPRLAIAGMLARDHVYEEAGRELEALRENHPDFIPGLEALGRAYQLQEKWNEAAAVYADLARLQPWDPEPWNNLGTIYVQIGFYDQAVRALETALRIDPGYTVARDNLEGLRAHGLAPGGAAASGDSLRTAQEDILALIRNGETAGADSSIQAAYARFGRRPELVFVEGTLNLIAGKPARAVTLFESIRDAMKGNVIFLNNLGTAYTQAGRLDDARTVLEEAMKIQPSNRRIQINLDQVKAAQDSLKAAGKR